MRCTVERGRLDPMTAAVKAVLKQAMQLSPEERAELANALDGMSADAPALSPDDLAAAWRPELDRRREELERGEVQTVDAREAIAGIRARLRSGK
jgi:putative addiction module component (TIGR02574 family)